MARTVPGLRSLLSIGYSRTRNSQLADPSPESGPYQTSLARLALFYVIELEASRTNGALETARYNGSLVRRRASEEDVGRSRATEGCKASRSQQYITAYLVKPITSRREWGNLTTNRRSCQYYQVVAFCTRPDQSVASTVVDGRRQKAEGGRQKAVGRRQSSLVTRHP
jgi:hypothetical protein